ncbi:hypothetical protein DL762_000160 [Monosporascus cannonballus]|uniref:Uncharacterized protein n=1 Tax=Monosporascus cannonballus TaxID=155416 RepID=A0ABY0HMZ0_9PEZI|nr:hypothetical protein DL762_000160 [Monosporascus cannonballus]
MTGSLVARKRNIQCRTKVKTGCATCRYFTSQPINSAHAGGIKIGAGLQPIRPTLTEITPQAIDLLNRYFSTKTMFNVKLGCDEEARQVLQASLTDPPIRHAVSSLRALREDFETSGDIPASVAQQTPSYDYGLQQYCTALGGLASNLSSPGSNGLKSALLCCQIFISIEQVRGNYSAMAQHIIQGLRIMHEYRARPNFDAANKLVPAHHDQLPFLDVFIIKLFAAPCKFADPPATADVSGTTVSVCLISPHQQPIESRDLRTIAPDMRTELTRIAASTLEFLGKISRIEEAGNALRLLSEKASLLDSLESWLIDLELVQTEIRPPGPELLSVTFMRFFHQILKIVLLGALDSSPDLYAKLRTETDRLEGVASNVEDIVGFPGHFLRSLLRRYEAERAVDRIDGTTIDDVGGEGVDVDRVLRTHHLSSAHSVEDAHLPGRELRLKLFGTPRTAGDLQVFDPFQDSVALGGVHGHEGVQAKANCLGYFLLGELAVDVGSPLNYCNSSTTIGVEGGLLSSTETLTWSEEGKRALKTCFVPIVAAAESPLATARWTPDEKKGAMQQQASPTMRAL